MRSVEILNKQNSNWPSHFELPQETGTYHIVKINQHKSPEVYRNSSILQVWAHWAGSSDRQLKYWPRETQLKPQKTHVCMWGPLLLRGLQQSTLINTTHLTSAQLHQPTAKSDLILSLFFL